MLKHQKQVGCGFMLATGAVILGLLLINSIFVRLFFGVNLANLDERVFQAIQFILPIVMLFIEFWFWDWFTFYRKRWKR